MAGGEKYSAEDWDAYIEELERCGGTLYVAARNRGIDPNTIVQKRKRDEAFDARVRAARLVSIQRVEHAVYRDATGRLKYQNTMVTCPDCASEFRTRLAVIVTGATQQIFYLANRDPENWKRHDDPMQASGYQPDDIAKLVLAFQQEAEAVTHGQGVEAVVPTAPAPAPAEAETDSP